MITPFIEGRLDEAGFEANLEIQACVDGVVIAGSTGEGHSLSLDEVDRLTKLAAMSPLETIVGVGASSTWETVERMERAAKCGADGALVVTPPYIKPTQEGIFRHFEACSKVGLPIMVYNHPYRTGANIEVETVERIGQLPNIMGYKNAGPEQEIHSIPLFAGDDLAYIDLDCVGLVSVLSNLLPQEMKRFVQTREGFEELKPMMEAMNLEPNPIPIKAAMQRAGLAAGEPRMPLLPMTNVERIPQWSALAL